MAQKIHFQNRIKKVSFCMNTRARSFSSRAKVLAQKYTSFCSRFQFLKGTAARYRAKKNAGVVCSISRFFATFRPLLLMYSKLRMQLEKKMGCSGQFGATQLVANAKQARRQATSSLPVRMWIIPAHEKNLRKSFMLLGSPQLNPCDSCQK